jgi:hypothetical protein
MVNRTCLVKTIGKPKKFLIRIQNMNVNYWWFGINNVKVKQGHHIIYSEMQPFLFNQQDEFIWNYGGTAYSKKFYQQMQEGDKIVLWMGHGFLKEWGILGFLYISKINYANKKLQSVIVKKQYLPQVPLTPYPKNNPQETENTIFLKEAFGLNFPALKDVFYQVKYVSKRTTPVTIDKITNDQYTRIFKRFYSQEYNTKINKTLDRNISNENFSIFWKTLQTKLKVGDSIKNWTARKGYLGDEFTIIQVLDDRVKIGSPNAQIIQIARKPDFEFMFSKWEAYCLGEFKRTELVKQTRVSKYTMSIIKHLEVLPITKPIFTEEEIKFTEKTVVDVEKLVAGFEGKERDVIARARVNQGKFREMLLNYWDNACAVSGLKEEKLLIASHILPWSKSTKQQQGDPFNGLLLSVVWDSLFDKGLISFDDNGQAILEKLNDETMECLGLNKEPYIIFPNKLTIEHKQYLNMHRILHGFI